MRNEPTATTPSQASLSDVRGMLRRRAPVILVGALLGVVVGFLVSARIEPPAPTATVDVEVIPTGVELTQSSARSSTALDIDRAVIRASSQEVIDAVVADLEGQVTAAVLREQLTVEQLNEAPVLQITVTLPTDQLALVAADAIAVRYLELEAADATSRLDADIAELEARLDETQSEIGQTGVQIGATEDPSRIAALTALQDAAIDRARILEERLLDLRAQNVDPGGVVRAARLVETGLVLGQTAAVPGIAALGLLLGLAAALVVDRTDRRVWEVEDLTAATGSTDIVVIPRKDLAGDGLRNGGGHRRLRTLTAPTQVTRGSVLVTGASADHGAGVAAGLAVAVAATGRRVLLIDATGADAFDLPGGDLDGWLDGRVGIDRAARSPQDSPSIQVLSGRPTRELGASSALRELLASPTLVVIVHVTGGSESGDALTLAEVVDRIVVVAAARKDARDVVARTYRWLDRDSEDAPVLTLVG